MNIVTLNYIDVCKKCTLGLDICQEHGRLGFMIKISHGSQFAKGEMSDKNGYGYATENMLNSLERLGYHVDTNLKDADVEIWFDQPHNWKIRDGVYTIGYHPWESTELLKNQKPDWLEQMNKCDEIWTPSPLIAKWYVEYMGVRPPVYVYEHGVSPDWTPKKRTVDGTFKFLHVGGEAMRKGAKEAMQALRLGFGKNEDVSLTMKTATSSLGPGFLPRINTVGGLMPLEELIQLFHDHHAFVYPSYGEGFGLTPLQALATGMPTITLPAWAPYGEFLNPNLEIDSKLGTSPFRKLHPGMMFHPQMESIISSMRYVRDNYEEVQNWHHAQLDLLMEKYSWDSLTAEAFEALEKRLSAKK